MIRSHDREVMRRTAGVVISRRPDGAQRYHFACAWCAFRRDYATEAGAVTSAAAHVDRHGKRLSLPRATP